MPYVEIHRHSEYSHDGSGKAMWAAQYAKELGHTALGLTDHGVITGLVDHYQACRSVGIKPILGCEIYFQPTFRKPTQYDDTDINDHLSVTTERYHLTVICRTLEGYRNLCRMLTQATETFYKVPIVTLETLLAHAKGLYFLTGCISSYSSQMIVAGKQDLALDCIKRVHDASDGGVYLEVQPFAAPGQEDVNRQLLVWSEIYGYPLVMTSDAHFVKADHFPMHQLMQKVRKPYQDGLVPDFSVRHIHTVDEMFDAWYSFMSYPDQGLDAISNTQKIADSCDVIFDTSFKMPVLDWLVEKPATVLPKLVRQGLLEKGICIYQNGKKVLPPDYRDRVMRELKVIIDRGFAPYMLLCADIVQYCHDNDIMVQARGSVCGSEVAHALGISSVDAIKYGTSFERFIGTRTTMPDIDLDIEDARKGEVVAYVTAKYPGQAAQICTFGSFKQKAAINGIVKASAMDVVEAELFRDVLMHYPDVSLAPEYILANPEARRYEDSVRAYCYLHGQVSFIGKHAAGVAITDAPLSEYMAVMRVGSGSDIEYVTSYDMEALDQLGVLKIDLLGLSTLSVVKDGMRDAGVSPDDDMLWDMFNDKKVLENFARGNTVGIFQSERMTPRRMYMQLRPRDWHDLAIVTACNRPLPLQEGTFQAVLDGRAGKSSQSLWYAQTKETEGAIVYQEQVHRICMEVAQMTQAQADTVLKSLKKYHENNAELEQVFVDGCQNQGIAVKEAKSLWQHMRRYLFNKSHAVSYAMLSAEQMWLRLNHPASFWLATLRHEGDKNKRRVYAATARKDGVGILTPHVNGGALYQKVMVGGRAFIQEGLINFDGIGLTTARAIEREKLRNGEFVNKEDVERRLGGMKAKLAILEHNGAFSFGQEYVTRVAQYANALSQVSTHVG